MVGEIFASFGAFKAMFDLTIRLKDISDAATRNAVAIELQEKILAAQAQQAALVEQVRELEERVAKFEAWDAEMQRYQLTDFGGGTFAYLLKPDMSNGEPTHRICTTCYQQKRKSILQFQSKTAYGQDRYHCPACDKDCEFGARSDPLAGRSSWSPRG